MPEIFPGLPYPASSIKKYLRNLNYFMLKLHDGRMIPFSTSEPQKLVNWLKRHRILEVWEDEANLDD